MADIYDETFLGNADVPNQGKTTESSGAKGPPSTKNVIPADYQTDGTNSPRVTPSTTMAAANSTPGGGKSQYPDIQTYAEGSV